MSLIERSERAYYGPVRLAPFDRKGPAAAGHRAVVRAVPATPDSAKTIGLYALAMSPPGCTPGTNFCQSPEGMVGASKTRAPSVWRP